MKLYGAFRSRAMRPLWLLYESGAAFEHVPVLQAYRLADPGAAEAPLNTRSAAFLAVNPMGGIPAFADGDLVLTESMAITLHLARTVGGDLGPRDGAEDARFQNWAFFAATSIEETALTIQRAHLDGRPDAPEVARAIEALARPLAVVEARLAAEGHPEGGRFTAADICLAEVIRYGTARPDLLDPWPATRAWLAGCHARPAFQRLWAARNAEPV